MVETKFGKCDWCNRHDVLLHSVVGQHEGKIWAGWICAECLMAKRKQEWGSLFSLIYKEKRNDE